MTILVYWAPCIVIVVKCRMSHTAKQQQPVCAYLARQVKNSLRSEISCHANYKQQTTLCDVWAFTSGNTGIVRNQR